MNSGIQEGSTRLHNRNQGILLLRNRLLNRIEAVAESHSGCEATTGQANREANTAPGRLSPQPEGLKPFVDFCGVARSVETAASIAQRSRLQKSANGIQRHSWDLISGSLTSFSAFWVPHQAGLRIGSRGKGADKPSSPVGLGVCSESRPVCLSPTP